MFALDWNVEKLIFDFPPDFSTLFGVYFQMVIQVFHHKIHHPWQDQQFGEESRSKEYEWVRLKFLTQMTNQVHHHLLARHRSVSLCLSWSFTSLGFHYSLSLSFYLSIYIYLSILLSPPSLLHLLIHCCNYLLWWLSYDTELLTLWLILSRNKSNPFLTNFSLDTNLITHENFMQLMLKFSCNFLPFSTSLSPLLYLSSAQSINLSPLSSLPSLYAEILPNFHPYH